MFRPKLIGIPGFKNNKLFIQDSGAQYVVDAPNAEMKLLLGPLKLMDGQHTVQQLGSSGPLEKGSLEALIESLGNLGLVSDVDEPHTTPALEVLFDLEDLSNELLYDSIYRNVFWRILLSDPASVPLEVFYGMAIENYHFLFRESYFDAPVLNYPGDTRVRVLMNEFYAEEFGHDELILKGLNAVGISREDLADTIPLPETMALCNALSFWARYDPIFFFSTLGVLEGKDLKIDSFVQACERRGIDENFIKPIRQHAEINMKGEHGSLARAMFSHLPALSEQAWLRMRAQTRLFVRIYDRFYTGIWNYYSTSNELLRRVSELEGAKP
jgi:hypothetical protein